MPEEEAPVLFRLTHMRQSLRNYMQQISKMRGVVMAKDINWNKSRDNSGLTVLHQSQMYFLHYLKMFPSVKSLSVNMPFVTLKSWAIQTYYPIISESNDTTTILDVPKVHDMTESLSAHPLSVDHLQIGLSHVTGYQRIRTFHRSRKERETGDSRESSLRFRNPMLSMLHIMTAGTVYANGSGYSANMVIHSTGCNSDKPGSDDLTASSYAIPEVFSIAQPRRNVAIDAPDLGYYHTLVEELSRLTPFLDFLKDNPQIKIHVSKHSRYLEQFLDELGIIRERIRTGTVRAKAVYYPRGTLCAHPSLLQIQSLALYLHKPITREEHRETIILIHNSLNHFFLEHGAIVKTLRNITKSYDLTLEVFSENKLPPLFVTRSIFNRAAMIIGPHSGALANMIFSRSGTIIIEGLCADAGKASTAYARLAYMLGHRYYGLQQTDGDCIDISSHRIYNIVKAYIDLIRRPK